jgi:hypothetical protein
MARPQLNHDTPVPVFVPDSACTRYLVVHGADLWMIKFNGEEFGPYKSEREALLFAVDAAQKLGEQGDDTQVLLMDENGEAQPVWTFGHDPYPPKQ